MSAANNFYLNYFQWY